MHAILFEHFGTPAELHLQEVPKPVPGVNEVLVEVHAASINPSDPMVVQGAMKQTTLPRIPGRDFAGIVVEGPQHLVGAEVWGTGGDLGFTRDGTHAQYILLPVSAVRAKPQVLTMEQAASVGVTYVTAWLCAEAAQLQPQETVLVIGATGGVGSAAVQIAKWKGAHVIGTIRRDSDRETVQQIGADTAINSETEELASAVKAATGGRGADVIVDSVGGAMVPKCLEALATGGRLTEISVPPKQQQVSIDMMDFYRRQLRLLGINTLDWDANGCAGILETLAPGFESNVLRAPSAIQKQALEDAPKAYEQVLNHAKGKVVLVPKQ